MPPNDSVAALSAALAGRYQIVRELGAGGMATVYLAHDVRHDRKVALKVMKPDLAAVIGAERFLSEIKTTANLQHPHILALFDSGEVNGTVFYVMPFVEGESLRDRLARETQLPVADAVSIAREVGDALEYAHSHGVIHRDIKPENIMLQGGHALVADFGIALAAAKTGSTRLTETGMSLGTPAYMSPEQAMGDRTIDARTDLYALGCVLFEMLAGEAPFTGPTAQAIVAKVLTEAPRSLRALRQTVPANVDAAVRHALEKLPADRFKNAAEFVQALTSTTTPSWSAPIAADAVSRKASILRYAAMAAVVAAAFVGGRVLAPQAASNLVPSRLAILTPTIGGSGSAGLGRHLALTRDGTTLVYVGLDSRGQNSLFRQRLDASEPTLIQGAQAAQSPQISYDGRSIYALSGADRFRIPLAGGERVPLGPGVETVYGASSPDGSYWFSSEGGFSRYREGDTLVTLPRTVVGTLTIQQVLDDGEYALMTHKAIGSSVGATVLFNLRTHDTVQVSIDAAREVRYTTGHLVYVKSDGTMHAVPFDVRAKRTTGSSVQIASDVSSVTGASGNVVQLAVSANGTVAYVAQEPQSFVLVDRNGASRLLAGEQRNFHGPKFSPDGKRIAIDFTGPAGRSIWMLSVDQGTMTRATFERDSHDATWTPDGKSIFYTTILNGVLTIRRKIPGSTAPAESLYASSKLGYTGVWLNGDLLTGGVDLAEGSGTDIGIVRNGGRGPVEPVVASKFIEMYGMASPDGKWLVYVSDQSGRQEVYVRPMSGGVEDVMVSERGGTEPVWGPSGLELFYRGEPDGRVTLMQASLAAAGTQIRVASRKSMFSVADVVTANPHANYDVSPDGKTFAMVRRSPASRIVVIQNVAELVKSLGVPGNR